MVGSCSSGGLVLCFLVFVNELSDILALISIELPENFFVDVAGGVAIGFDIVFRDRVFA